MSEKKEKKYVHLFKDYYVQKLSCGCKIVRKRYEVLDIKTKKMKKVDEPNYEFVSFPHEKYIYKSAIRHYELELLEDEEVKNFKDMVKKMEELKIEINENLTKGNN